MPYLQEREVGDGEQQGSYGQAKPHPSRARGQAALRAAPALQRPSTCAAEQQILSSA